MPKHDGQHLRSVLQLFLLGKLASQFSKVKSNPGIYLVYCCRDSVEVHNIVLLILTSLLSIPKLILHGKREMATEAENSGSESQMYEN